MSISFLEFLGAFVSNPALAIVSILTMGVILVNGWTGRPQRNCNLRFHAGHVAPGGHCYGHHPKLFWHCRYDGI